MIGIYCITNKVNNKKYIGQSWRIEQRFKEHVYKCCNAHLASAFKKYGTDNFFFGVVETFDNTVTQETLDIVEADYINASNLTDSKYGYNMRLGGSRGKHNAESRAKLGLAVKGRKLSEEHKAKIVIPLIGRYYSPETRAKIGIAQKGKIVSAETLEKQRLSHIGKKQKQESIDKMVATQKANRLKKQSEVSNG
jgi:group I intron endonuclease